MDQALYRQFLGKRFDRLPPAVAAFHDSRAARCYRGRARVERGINPIARLLADLMGLPRAGRDVPMSLTVTPTRDGELWQRSFADRCFTTVQRAGDRHFEERFGPLTARMHVPMHSQGLRFQIERLTVFGLPFPKALCPRVDATESCDGDRLIFDVDIVAPGLGRIVHYRGWLLPDPATAPRCPTSTALL